MLNKKSYFILLILLLIIGLAGCGGGGGNANLDVSTSSSGAQLMSISITPADPTLAENTSKQFTATGIYSDNTTQDLTSSVTWTTSPVDVASGLDEARFTGLYASNSGSYYRPGYITATHWGRARICGKWGNTSGCTGVTVTQATLVSLTITPANPSMAPGTKQQFTATGTFSDNTTQDLTTDATWSSSATTVAQIGNAAGSKGLATGIGAGTTSITAIFGGISGSAALTVTTASGGAATISLAWDAPTTNPDGTPLTGLAGYKIYYGTSSGSYTTVLDAGNTTAYVIYNLAPGTYYIVTTAYYASGGESGYSNEVSKTIQ